MKKILPLFLITVFLLPNFVSAQLSQDPAFNPGFLISDEAFADVLAFGSAAGIQKFLEQKNSMLANTQPEFLIKLKEPDTLTKVALEDPQPNLGRLRTAAELIYDASTKHGLNPQVLLVKLEKEQSLITGRFDDIALQRRMDRALGFGCPDYEGCGDIFLGFYRQFFGTFDVSGSRWIGAAASLMRSFRTEVNGVRVGRGPMVDAQNQVFGKPLVRTARKGDTIVLDNTLGGFQGVSPTQTVTLQNFATAALYRYTPHVYNGNYNFWRLYHLWFRYPNGTVIKLLSDAQTYVIDNGTKRQFSAFVAQQRKIKTDNVIIVSQTEFDSYFTEKPLTPVDSTLIKGDADSMVYMVQETKKRPISGPVFVQRKLSFAKVITLPQAEVLSYETGAFLAPVDKTLFMGESDPTVYMMDSELKRPITYEVFVARKLSFKNLMKITDTEAASIPSGPFLYPPDQVAVKLKGDDGIYWFRDNQKRYVSAFVYKQRGVSFFPHISLGQTEFDSIPTSTPFPPRDGTVIKGDKSSGIFVMENGLKRLLTAEAYKRMRNPVAAVLPQGEVDDYASGETVLK
jgi:hypothetical protein